MVAMHGLTPNPRVSNGRRKEQSTKTDTGWMEVKSKRRQRWEKRQNIQQSEPPPIQTKVAATQPSVVKNKATVEEEILQLRGARTRPTALLKVQGIVHSVKGEMTVQPMIDSGASGTGFVDPTFVARCGAIVRPSQRQVALADGTVVQATGEVDLKYALASKTGPPLQFTSTFIVTPLEPYELILGIGWLEHHQAQVAFHERSMMLRVDGQGERRAIRALERLEEDGSPALAPLRMMTLSSRGFHRAMRRGECDRVYAVFVRGLEDEVVTMGSDISKVPGSNHPLIRQLLSKFQKSVFPEEPPPGVPPKRGVEHAIQLKPDARLPAVRPLRHESTKDSLIIKNYIEAGLKSGILQPSTSPYGSMILIVPKKDGTPRLVVDYRALNEITIKNKYPLPLMDELFDRVAGAQWFTKIDLRSGFHQIAIRPEDREKTAFRTRYGSFEYTVLPMGLCNAPGTFMQLMNETFADMLDKSVLCFLDDILIYSPTEEEHIKQVTAVMERLQSKKLYGKLSKCEFMQREVEFLGHRIGADGLRVAPDKIGAVQKWPRPRSVTEVRSFLGLGNFYRRFVKGYSRLALPLTELTKDTAVFRWGDTEQKAFEALKATLCSPPVLIIPDQTKQFALSCDACKYSIGAVLQQDLGRGLQPVAYFSAKLSDAERNYDVRELEFMAIYRACLHWRPYLHGLHPFRLLSDHKSLLYYMTMPNLSGRLARWVEKMQEFDCGIEYIKGEANVVADALSRRVDHAPTDEEIKVSEPTSCSLQAVVQAAVTAAICAIRAAEAPELRQRNIDAAIKVVPLDPTLPQPNKNGTIMTPTQRCAANNASGAQCGQRTAVGHLCWNHLQRDLGVRVRPSGVAGRGLFVAWESGLSPKHRIPYTGDEIILSNDKKGGPYVLEVKNGVGIDAARRNCGVGRWVNDPRGATDEAGRPRQANCEFVVHTPRGAGEGGQRVAAVRTLHQVKKGEELLVAYGNQYWRFSINMSKKAKKQSVKRVAKARQNKVVIRSEEQGVSSADLPPDIDPNTQRARKRVLRRHPTRVIASTVQLAANLLLTETNSIALANISTSSTRRKARSEKPEPLTVAVRRVAQRDEAYQTWLAKPPTGWTTENGLLFDEHHRLRVPNDRVLRTRLLAEVHDSTTGAHAGRDRMLSETHKRFHWDGLPTDVEHYVTTCETCQRNKHSKQLKPGLLMPLPIPEEPCMYWTTDAVCGLLKTKYGHTSIQVYVDRRTKLKHFAATRTTDGSTELAATTLRTIIGPHGMPKSIVSDRDPRITARFYRELQRVLGSQTDLSTAMHAQSDGQSEREIQTLITALRSYVNEMGDDWDEYLPALELAFNSKVQASTGASPFYLVYGVDARLPIDCMMDEVRPSIITVPAVADRKQRMKKAMDAARSKQELAQERQKRVADRHRRLLQLKEGDQVMLSTEGLRMRSGTHKLTARYIGPFLVKGTINDNAVTLELPPLLRAIHPTVNISRLKLYRDGSTEFPDRPHRHHQPPAVETDTNGVSEYEVECIVAQRGPARRRQLLVRWVGYGSEHDQWKSRSELVKSAGIKVAEFDALQQPPIGG